MVCGFDGDDTRRADLQIRNSTAGGVQNANCERHSFRAIQFTPAQAQWSIAERVLKRFT